MAELWPGGPIELPHTIIIDGVALTIPEQPTGTLLHWLATGSWWHLVPNSVDLGEVLPLLVRLADNDDVFDLEHLWEPAMVLFGRLAGTMPTGRRTGGTGWWPAVRLAASAMSDWPLFSAWCASNNINPMTVPLWQAIAASYAWLRSLVNAPEQMASLEQDIWGPPPITAMATYVSEPQELPQHVRDEEAALALAALRESMPGEDRISEWTFEE